MMPKRLASSLGTGMTAMVTSALFSLWNKMAKPAVAFGGKYRIIDFPLSNCINSGVDTVGVLTQYQPLRLNSHIGIGLCQHYIIRPDKMEYLMSKYLFFIFLFVLKINIFLV